MERYTDEEICALYRESGCKKKQIPILQDLALKSRKEIVKILMKGGFEMGAEGKALQDEKGQVALVQPKKRTARQRAAGKENVKSIAELKEEIAKAFSKQTEEVEKLRKENETLKATIENYEKECIEVYEFIQSL